MATSFGKDLIQQQDAPHVSGSADRLTQPNDEEGDPHSPFAVEGVDASAGGLEAYAEFLEGCSADSGIARVMVQHLSPKHKSLMSVIADGAAWIWEQACQRLSPKASWCVDVYHVSEDLHKCARAMHGEGETARRWAETELEKLIHTGGPKYLEQLNQIIAATTDADHLAALKTLHVYLKGNQDRMWYKQRLNDGKPIGSGAIEGACKKIGSRIKLNSARWRIQRAQRFGALLCLEYADQTSAFWKSKAA